MKAERRQAELRFSRHRRCEPYRAWSGSSAETGGFPLTNLPYAGMGPARAGSDFRRSSGAGSVPDRLDPAARRIRQGQAARGVGTDARADHAEPADLHRIAGYPNVTPRLLPRSCRPGEHAAGRRQGESTTAAKATLESADFKTRFVDQLGYEVVASAARACSRNS